LVKRLGSRLGGKERGIYYPVVIPEDDPSNNPNIPPEKYDETETGCMAPDATINDDDIKSNHHHQKATKLAASLWKTTPARLRRQRKKRQISCSCSKRMRKRPETAGINRIRKPTRKTAPGMCRQQNRLGHRNRCSSNANKDQQYQVFRPGNCNPAGSAQPRLAEKRLEKIVHKIRDISVCRANYSMADFGRT